MVAAALMTGIVSFVWLYPTPLSVDLPLHLAVAKAFLDLTGHPDLSGYPYYLSVHLSSYALPEFLLIPLVKLFGVVAGAKIALSLYVLFFPLAVWYLVGAINPEARWSRLAGFPLTLNYVFHWGFWTTMIGIIVAIFTIGVSLRHRGSRTFLVSGALLRAMTFLMHPAPLLAVGIFDVGDVLLDPARTPKWYLPRNWHFKPMILLWIPAAVLVGLSHLSMKSASSTSLTVKWGTVWGQLQQLVRPAYLTYHWYEEAVPAILALVLITLAAFWSLRSKHHCSVLVGSVLVLAVGLIIPVERFFGNSQQIGARLVLIGLVLLIALVGAFEHRLKRAIILWLVLAYVTNLGVSHYLWHRHSPPFEEALTVVKNQLAGERVRLLAVPTPSSPSIPLGGNVPMWAWCHGYLADAYNAVGMVNDFGPVKYTGTDSTAINQGNGIVLYHPYMATGFARPEYSQTFMNNNDIYTVQRR